MSTYCNAKYYGKITTLQKFFTKWNWGIFLSVAFRREKMIISIR